MSNDSSIRLDTAQDIIGYKFHDVSLLKQALTHPSANKAYDKLKDYQRLEFLGDSLLEAIVSVYIYDNFSEYITRRNKVLKELRN